MTSEFKAHSPKSAKTPRAAAPRPQGAAVTPEKIDQALERKKKAAQGKDKALDPKTWPEEVGGPDGPEPTRYGDWERRGICVDF